MRYGPRAVCLAFIGLALSGLAGCATTATPEVRESRQMDPSFARQNVSYTTREPAGTIVVDPSSHFLYLVQGGGKAIRYGVGVGADGFVWSGRAAIHSKQEWPDWYPTAEMLERKPEIRPHLVQLKSGLGMKGGPENPIGARALYLWSGNKDTLYRIHGTNEPWTIGTNVSSGCIRLTNDDMTDLYSRAKVGTKVVVLNSGGATALSSAMPGHTSTALR
jgi:lipoprotein-anchoring transpeptidase ErfK/SrfK